MCFQIFLLEHAEDVHELRLFRVVIDGRLAVVRVDVDEEDACEAVEGFLDGFRVFFRIAVDGELEARVAVRLTAAAFFAHGFCCSFILAELLRYPLSRPDGRQLSLKA